MRVLKQSVVKIGFIAVILAVLVVGGLALFSDSEERVSVCFSDGKQACIRAQIADDEHEREEGLMYITHLKEDEGMLFVFDVSGRYPFWMKETLIPLDIIWINEQKYIVSFNENTPPCEAMPCPAYDPQTEARYVLEVPAGTISANGASLGERIWFEFES